MIGARYSLAMALPGIVAIVDEFHPEHPSRTITNAAEDIVSELWEAGLLIDHPRLIYRDSDGWWDEIAYDRFGVVGFAPLRVRTLEDALALALPRSGKRTA